MRKSYLVRKKRIWFHGPKILPWGHSPGLKGFVGWFISRRKIMGFREEENIVVVQNTQLDQRAKEDDLLKSFKDQSWIFA